MTVLSPRALKVSTSASQIHRLINAGPSGFFRMASGTAHGGERTAESEMARSMAGHALIARLTVCGARVAVVVDEFGVDHVVERQ